MVQEPLVEEARGEPTQGRGLTVKQRSVDRRQSMTDEEKQRVASMLNALMPFVTIRNTMPLQYVRAFLLVALNEGLGVQEYARQAGVAQSVMSRHLLDLGDRDRYGGEGFGLITQRQDPLNLRRHQAMLTDRGRAVAGSIVRAMGG